MKKLRFDQIQRHLVVAGAFFLVFVFAVLTFKSVTKITQKDKISKILFFFGTFDEKCLLWTILNLKIYENLQVFYSIAFSFQDVDSSMNRLYEGIAQIYWNNSVTILDIRTWFLDEFDKTACYKRSSFSFWFVLVIMDIGSMDVIKPTFLSGVEFSFPYIYFSKDIFHKK